MVPFPVDSEFLAVEVVGADNGRGLFRAAVVGHRLRYLAVLVAEHGPSVDPAAWHQGEYASDGSAVLEYDSPPISVGVVDYGALCGVGESGEIVLKHRLALVGACDFVGAVAELTARTVRRPVDDHYVVFAVVLYGAASFVESGSLFVLLYDHLVDTALLHAA